MAPTSPTADERTPRAPRPPRPLEQEAFLALGRSWSVLEHSAAEALRSHGITPKQYNVLRILRGAGEGGLCRGEIMDRMISSVPDATRLLDRLQAAGLIVRGRSEEDRRFVTAHLTDAGAQLLADLDEVVLGMHREQFSAFTEDELRTLLRLLAELQRTD